MMIELRLPDELYQRLEREAAALNLSSADFLQVLLNSCPVWMQSRQQTEDFYQLMQQSFQAHAHLLQQEELWA